VSARTAACNRPRSSNPGASPQAASEVDASIANGNLLEVRSTPTVFVNGRRTVGADPHAIQQYIDFELAQMKAGKK